ncbi:unnamed protein product [Absidia cylindrospora]
MLWRVLNAKNEAVFTNIMTGLVESNPPVGAHVRHVHLDHFLLTDTPFLDFMKHTGHVDDLIMEAGYHITDTSFQHLPRHYPNLKQLILRESRVILQSSIETLAQHCHQLTKLDLASYPGVPCHSFFALASCPLLEELALSVCKMKVDDDDDDIVLDLSGGFQRLWYLEITNSPSHFTHLVVNSLLHHPDWLPCLKEFEMDGADTLTERQAIDFIKSHSALHALTLANNTLTDAFLRAIASSLPQIAYVGLSFCTRISARGVRRLVLDCQALEWVQLDGCGMRGFDFPEWGDRGAYSDDEEEDEGEMDEALVEYLDEATISAIQSFGDERIHDDEDDDGDDEWQERLARWDFQDRVARGEIEFGFVDDD